MKETRRQQHDHWPQYGRFQYWWSQYCLSQWHPFLWLNLLLIGGVAGMNVIVPLGARAQNLETASLRFLAQLSHEELEDVDYWRDLCTLQAEAGELEDALAACEQAIALEPEESDLWALHSEVLLRQESYPEAIASATQALNFDEENSLALANQCVAFFELDQTEKALDLCNEALRINGSWGDRSPAVAWRQRGRLLNQQGDFDQALTAYDRTLLLEPEDSLTLAYRCQVFVNLNQLQDAIDSCQQALAGNGNWGSESAALAWNFQGVAQQQLGQYDEAIAAYDQALSIDPENVTTWTNQGRLLELLQRPEEALVSYTQAVTLQADHSRALVGQCAMLNQLGQYDAALEACDQAIAGDGEWWQPGAAQAWSQKSFALSGLGQPEEALAMANRAVGIRPIYAEAWNNRAVVLWYLERYPEAVESTNRAIELDAAYARPWATQGSIRRALGQYELALMAYEQALHIDPDVSDVWANRSLVLWHLQDYETAILSANRAINLNPESFQGWLNRAAALVALNQINEAFESYQRAVQLNPTSADAWTGLGVVLIQLEQIEEATAAIQQALALNAEQPLAIAVMETLQNYQMNQP